MKISDLKTYRDIEKIDNLVWQITLQDVETGEKTRLLTTLGFEEAARLGLKLQSDAFGRNILVSVENLTMADSAYYLDLELTENGEE